MNDYVLALLGGILIGASSSTMLGGLGRITGISGIIGSVLSKPQSEHNWRYSFLGGLLFGGFALLKIKPELFSYNLDQPVLNLVIAGLLVGFGTRLGSGCTSGHGVCGLARMAKRSFVATLLFIGFGMITVFIKGALV